MEKRPNRTSAHLRDLLFDEIDQMRGADANPTRALAVAKLAREIISIATVEIDFMREVRIASEGSALETPNGLGSLQLGSTNAGSATNELTAPIAIGSEARPSGAAEEKVAESPS